MATLANSTPASCVQTDALAPTPPLAVDTLVALYATESDKSRDSLMAAGHLPPAALPSLQTAFSRRRALFGAVAAVAAPAVALPATTIGISAAAAHLAPAVHHHSDGKLEIIANEMAAIEAALEARHLPDDEFNNLILRLDTLSVEMDGMPADTFAGVLHKLRVIELPITSDDGHAHDLMVSICEDVSRLHATGALHG